MSKEKETRPKPAFGGIVELGKVEELTGKDSVGHLSDGGGTSSNRKDKGGGAGE